MKTMKKDLFDELSQQAFKLLQAAEANTPIREMMARLYVDSLEDKTIEQGLLVSDEALGALRDFHEDYVVAVDDPNGTTEKLIARLTEGRELPERYKILTQLYAGIVAANAKLNGADQDQIDALIHQAEEEPAIKVTPEREAELRQNVLEALSESLLLQCGLERRADELEELASEYGVSHLVMQIGDDEETYEGLLTMLTYIASKKGAKDLPPDLTIQETACIVAAAVEEQRIAHRVELGELATNVAVFLLGVLGSVLILRVAFHIMLVGASLMSLFGVFTAIPAFLLMLSTVGVAVVVALTLWIKTIEVTPKLILTAVKTVVNGLRKLGGFIKSTVVPTVTYLVEKAYIFLRDLIFQKKTTVEGTVNV